MNRLSGVHTIMPTPFTSGGALDKGSLRELTGFLVGLGVDGVVVLGVMGEAHKLSESEQEQVIAITVEAADGRIPVFAGAGAAGTDLAVAKASRAQGLGASGLLVAPPPVQNDRVILDYYQRIGEAVSIPIILHDYPEATGTRMSVELVARLYEQVPAVQAVKLEEPPTGPKITALRRLGCEISIVGGLGGLYFLEELERGADGIMTGLAYPDLLVAIYRAYRSGDLDEARTLFFGACPLLRFEFQAGVGLALRKEIYRRRGAISSAYVRHPGAQIDEVLERELDVVLEHCGFTEVKG